MDEFDAAERWIFERLQTRAALVAAMPGPRFYPDQAPDGTPFPYVVFSLASPGPDRKALGGVRIMVKPTYLVRAYLETTDYRDLAGYAEEIEAALNLAPPGPVAGEGYLIGCSRSEAFRQIEREAGTEFRARGGFYELWVSDL